MCCRSHFNTVSTRLPCYLWNDPLKRVFLDIYLTTFFGVRKFRNTSAMRVTLFWKCSKLNLNFENAEKKKNWEKVFAFWDNCIWRCCHKLSLLRREYLSSAVNVLTNSPVILHITERDFFQPNCLYSDQQIWWNCCRSDFNSLSARFTMLLVEGSS